MKLKTTSLAALAAFTIAGPSSAAILLTDNFNSDNQFNSTFNNTLAADQGGTLATITYTTNIGLGTNNAAQHGNGANSGMLLAANGQSTNTVYASLNHNFATDANSADQVLEIKFNINVFNAVDPTDWATVALGASQNLFVNDANNKFSSLFRDNGGTQQFASGAIVGNGVFNFADGDLITLSLSDTAGTGSAFDGSGSVAKMYVNNVLQFTQSGLNLGVNDGYISFQAASAFGLYDNLSIATIPEPGAASLLGGLGMLALLRRRRA